MKFPSHNDWTSQVLKYMEDIQLNLELNDIAQLSKEIFKQILKKCVTEKAFKELLIKKENRKSENARGRIIIYEEFAMQETDIEISLDERKWFFKSRTDDIDIRANYKWKHEAFTCVSCKENIQEDNEHLLVCSKLIGKNELISYIPEYKDLFSENTEEQVYISRILKENFLTRNKFFA